MHSIVRQKDHQSDFKNEYLDFSVISVFLRFPALYPRENMTRADKFVRDTVAFLLPYMPSQQTNAIFDAFSTVR